jgi:DNA-binding beta-propeller fold protein YncE
MRGLAGVAVWAALLLAASTTAAEAQIAVSANDAKIKLVDGKIEVAPGAPADTIAFIDFRASPPKVLAEVNVPSSAAGAPSNVAVAPKEDIVLVAAGMQPDPADPSRTTPDNKLTVIDMTPLKPSILKRIGLSKGGRAAPAVIATLQAGKGASGVAINRAGTLALVANRAEGTVSVFTIAGTKVEAAGKVTVGGENSGPSAVAIAPDGKRALVTLEADNRIVVLAIDGTKVEPTGRVISAGLRPLGLDIASKGEVAVVANAGTGGGDADTISLIDLKLEPPRVAATYTVGPSPQGVKLSPDGRYVAVTVDNGSSQAADSPFFRENAVLQIWSRNGTQLTKAGEMAIGKWCRGVAWASNSRSLLVQCMAEEQLTVVSYSGLTGRTLQKTGTVRTKGAPAGLGTAQP